MRAFKSSNFNFATYHPCWYRVKSTHDHAYIRLNKFQIWAIVQGTDHDIRNNDVIVDITVKLNLKDRFFPETT